MYSGYLCAVRTCLMILVINAVPAFSQSYSNILAPNTDDDSWWAWCAGQDALVSISISPYNNTNGHYHNSGRPHSTPIPGTGYTDVGGYFYFTVRTTLIGQAEYAMAAFGAPCSGTPTLDFAVGYSDIYYNDHSDIWIQNGGDRTHHGDNQYNHWMESGSAYGLYYATLDYLAAHSPQTHVCVNDMALPFGGKFDITMPTNNWASPHAAHDRGSAVDVAGPGADQCDDDYEVNISQFLSACVNNGAVSSASVNENNHAHCNWMNPASYEH